MWKVDGAEWRLEDAQIWKPRVAPFVDPSTPNRPKLPWSQTGKYYDTAEHLQKCLESDWAIACEKGVEKLIERHDTAVSAAKFDRICGYACRRCLVLLLTAPQCPPPVRASP